MELAKLAIERQSGKNSNRAAKWVPKGVQNHKISYISANTPL